MGDIIICEGKSDLIKIKAINKEIPVLVTGGFSFGAAFINQLLTLEKNNRLLLFLDPDYGGESIRKRLHRVLKNPIDLYLPREKCQGRGKIGIEHASLDAIKKVLEAVHATPNKIKQITVYDLYTLGLIGHPNSHLLRNQVSNHFGFYQGNAKNFLLKINTMGISLNDLKACCHV